jgi:hypothetical protein
MPSISALDGLVSRVEGILQSFTSGGATEISHTAKKRTTLNTGSILSKRGLRTFTVSKAITTSPFAINTQSHHQRMSSVT